MTYKGRLVLFSLEKILKENLVTVSKYLSGGCTEEHRDRLVSVPIGDKMRSNGLKF